MEQEIAVVEANQEEQLRERMFSWLDSLHDPLIPRNRVSTLLNELWDLFVEYRALEWQRDKNRFAIADRILELEQLVGEVAYQFIDTIAEYFGYNETLLRQHLRVAQLFPPHVRKPHLRFSYYRMIAEIHLGTKDFAERQQRAWQLLEVVAAHAEAGAITSHYNDVKQLIRTELQARGWLQPSLPSPSDVVDVPFRILQETITRQTVPSTEPTVASEPSATPNEIPITLTVELPTRYIVRFTVQYGMDGFAEYSVVCEGTDAFVKTMESIVSLAESVSYQNGLLNELYIDSDDPLPITLLNQLSPAAQRLLCGDAL